MRRYYQCLRAEAQSKHKAFGRSSEEIDEKQETRNKENVPKWVASSPPN
jgi:hypothetical protein